MGGRRDISHVNSLASASCTLQPQAVAASWTQCAQRGCCCSGMIWWHFAAPWRRRFCRAMVRSLSSPTASLMSSSAAALLSKLLRAPPVSGFLTALPQLLARGRCCQLSGPARVWQAQARQL